MFKVAVGQGRLSLYTSQVTHQARAYPGFCQHKATESISTSAWMDASPSQGYPPALSPPVPIYTPGWTEGCESKVSCLKTQHNVPGQGSNHGPLDPGGGERTGHEVTMPLGWEEVNTIISSLHGPLSSRYLGATILTLE